MVLAEKSFVNVYTVTITFMLLVLCPLVVPMPFLLFRIYAL